MQGDWHTKDEEDEALLDETLLDDTDDLEEEDADELDDCDELDPDEVEDRDDEDPDDEEIEDEDEDIEELLESPAALELELATCFPLVQPAISKTVAGHISEARRERFIMSAVRENCGQLMYRPKLTAANCLV